jgi:hypothetical protein
MEGISDKIEAKKSESTLLVLFIPSVDRDEKPFDQSEWVTAALKLLGLLFGGATAFPQGQGVWRDDARGGVLVFDEPTVIQCYTNDEAIEGNTEPLRDFLMQMGRQTNQGAVGLVINRDYYEIQFSAEDTNGS